MELFTKTKAVKLRSHLDKYLVAGDDRETVRQSRNGALRKATWTVEIVENHNHSTKPSHTIRLKSCHGNYLTATETPFLLGMTGNRVALSDLIAGAGGVPEARHEWVTERDGFQVKLRSWSGKYLRANGGTPPWRNSVTHDDPHAAATADWVLWDVVEAEEVVAIGAEESLAEYLSSLSGLSSVSDEVLSELGSPVSVMSPRVMVPSAMASPRRMFSSPKFSFRREKKESNLSKLSSSIQPQPLQQHKSGMDLFHNAKAVRLKSHHDKYLLADEDESSVTQDRNGSSKNAKWTVEPVPGSESIIRLKSCYGKYLTASNQPFLLGMTGRRALQTAPRRLDSSLEWEPVREGANDLVKLKTRYGHFLRANGGLPPWRNSVTHDIPHRTSTQDWILWSIDVVEIQVTPQEESDPDPVAKPDPVLPHSDSLDFGSDDRQPSFSIKSNHYSRQESSDTDHAVTSPPKSEGRTIYYHIADDNGEVDDEAVEGYSFTFSGNSVIELTRKFEEETGIEGIVMCTRSPLNAKLYPLRLRLPPNNVTMQVVVVLAASKAAEEFRKQGLL